MSRTRALLLSMGTVCQWAGVGGKRVDPRTPCQAPVAWFRIKNQPAMNFVCDYHMRIGNWKPEQFGEWRPISELEDDE